MLVSIKRIIIYPVISVLLLGFGGYLTPTSFANADVAKSQPINTEPLLAAAQRVMNRWVTFKEHKQRCMAKDPNALNFIDVGTFIWEAENADIIDTAARLVNSPYHALDDYPEPNGSLLQLPTAFCVQDAKEKLTKKQNIDVVDHDAYTVLAQELLTHPLPSDPQFRREVWVGCMKSSWNRGGIYRKSIHSCNCVADATLKIATAGVLRQQFLDDPLSLSSKIIPLALACQENDNNSPSSEKGKPGP